MQQNVFVIKFVNIFVILFLKYSKISSSFDKNVHKVAKKLSMDEYSCWRGFFEEKMANLKVFIAKVCETYRRQHFIHENSYKVQH